MHRFLRTALFAWAGFSMIAFSQTYSTRFEGTENPLSEGGRWTNNGLDWTDIRKENGIAFSTQTGTNSDIYKYNDSFAHLPGFPPDQEAWGEARILKPNASCNQEVEILLRFTSAPHRATGYECFARCLSGPSSYVQIVRWDGPLGKFTYLADKRGTNYGLNNGDILKASVIGNVITVYINDVEKARATDDTFKTGNPGIGEFLACDKSHGFGSNPDFGFANFTARALKRAGANGSPPAGGAHHYVFFGRERQRISDTAFLETKAFEGTQLKYTWRELEPEEDAYDLSTIHRDLAFLASKGKKLFIQLQDVSFEAAVFNVPRYLLKDPRYHGGADKQYIIKDDDEEHARPEGWVARRWDPAVQERFHKLLTTLGHEFDGRIEGINLAETAVSFGESGRLYPKGFSPAIYRDAVLTDMTALKRAFPKSVTMQYANFMPGEWLPDNDRGYLRAVYERAKELKVGLGGPDLLPYKPGQMKHAYPLLRHAAGSVPTGIAVQEGNYQYENPKTARPITIPELLEFASEQLKVDYLFWSAEEPFYSGKLIPFLQAQR